MKIWLAIPLIVFAASSAYAGDAICAARPDLCGGAHRAKRKPAARGGRSEIQRVADDIEDDIEQEFENTPSATARKSRRPAAELYANTPGAVTYDSYLQANASHPAIARRPANMANNQKAFVNPVIRATITGSTLDQPVSAAKIGDAQPAAGGVNPNDTPTNLPDMSGPPR